MKSRDLFTLIIGLGAALFLAACVRAIRKPATVNPLPPPALGAADEFAPPPRP